MPPLPIEPSRSNRANALRSRAAVAADEIAELAAAQPAGTRLGSKAELRARSDVSVGTFNEALRILQSRGVVTLKSGPGGGLFTAQQSTLLRLGNELLALDREAPRMPEVARVVRALDPLIVTDAAHNVTPERVAELTEHFEAMTSASHGDISVFLRASLEVYFTFIAMSPSVILRSFGGVLINAQLLDAIEVEGAIDPTFTQAVQDHLAAVSDLIEAVVRGDAARALEVRRASDLAELFESATAASRSYKAT